MALALVTVEAVPVLEHLVADGAGRRAGRAMHRLVVATINPPNHLKNSDLGFLTALSHSIYLILTNWTSYPIPPGT